MSAERPGPFCELSISSTLSRAEVIIFLEPFLTHEPRRSLLVSSGTNTSFLKFFAVCFERKKKKKKL